MVILKTAGVAQRRLATVGSSRKRSRASGVVDILGRCCQRESDLGVCLTVLGKVKTLIR